MASNRKKHGEHEEQVALFEWARNPAVLRLFPDLRLLEGSLNGVKLTKAQAGKAKAAGMLKGSHDITLPVARGKYIGLSIELKYGKNKPTAEQLQVGEWLEEAGHKVVYCWGWDSAREEIEKYLLGRA
jgi:hypothetical protein